MELSPKGKKNSPEEEFVSLRENDAKRATSPWGRFISPRENDIGRLRECSSRGKFTLVNDKIVGKVNSPRKKARERHVSLGRLVLPRGRPNYLREEVVEKEKPMRCREGKAYEVYHSFCGFSWLFVACGTKQKISLKCKGPTPWPTPTRGGPTHRL